MSGYVIWKFSKNQDMAKEFLVALVDASRESMWAASSTTSRRSTARRPTPARR